MTDAIPSSSSAASSSSLRSPPAALLSRQFSALKAQPFFYTIGLLFLPLAASLLALIFVLHSALLAAGADVIIAFLRYTFFLLFQAPSSTTAPESHAENQLVRFQLPLLLALSTLRFLLIYTITKRTPHTTNARRDQLLFVAGVYSSIVYALFSTHAEKAQVRVDDLKSSDASIALSALFLKLYYQTFLFTVLTLVSIIWTPTSDSKLRAAEAKVLAFHKGPTKLTSHYQAHHSYLLLDCAKDVKDDGSGKKDEGDGVQKSPSPAPASASASLSAASSSFTSRSSKETDDEETPPLVFLHGYAGGKAFWYPNLAPISSALKCRTYALDLFGMGLSSHHHTMDWCRNTTDAEAYFVNALEAWRASLGLEKIILVCHSYGAYVGSCYAMRFPHRVVHLVLASPAGLPVGSREPGSTSKGPWWLAKYGLVPIFRWLWSNHITLSQLMHFLGPAGPFLFRLIIKTRFDHVLKAAGGDKKIIDLDVLSEYFYHLNAGAAPGHRGLNFLLKSGNYAYDPLLPRLSTKLKHHGVSLLFGDSDWMDGSAGQELVMRLLGFGAEKNNGDGYNLKQALQEFERAGAPSSTSKFPYHTECLIIPRSGHQLTYENPPDFNGAVVETVKQALVKWNKAHS